MLLRFFRLVGLAPSSEQLSTAMSSLNMSYPPQMEYCFNVEVSAPLSVNEIERLRWMLSETFEPEGFSGLSFLSSCETVAEVGPRFNFETAYSSTAVDICHNRARISKVVRLERSKRYGFNLTLSSAQIDLFLAPLHDRMTEMRYHTAPESLEVMGVASPVEIIDVLGAEWKANLLAFSKSRGLGWDPQDLEWYRWLYQDILKRNATDAELFGLGQGNSNHCRHWDFNAIWDINGQRMAQTLMQMVKEPLKANPANSKLAFCDDSSAQQGHRVRVFVPRNFSRPSSFKIVSRLKHPTCTAETHNHPVMWEPYQGDATKEGVYRDEECIGRGGEYGIGGDGHMVGNLLIPGYELPWENTGWRSLPTVATPLQISIRGTSGAFDYGNAYGHPIVYGFFRTVGITIGQIHFEYFKPVAYGVVGGSIDDAHLYKQTPQPGMLLALIGGPGYRIGVGGGSGSSMMGGENDALLDFNSVQRGDPQMGNRVHRVIRALTELHDRNPSVTWHDLGAAGVENTAKETVEKTGGLIYLRKIPVADPTLSTLEINSNESQERNLGVFRKRHVPIVEAIAEREGCPVAWIGEVTDTGRYVVLDERDGTTPVDLPLRETLGKLPPKIFRDQRVSWGTKPLELPKDLTVAEALERVLCLPSVASKEWLTRKVDRSVTGLIGQQQCIGPNHLPLADYAIKVDGYFGVTGTAYSLGERPLVGLISAETCARMVITEAILNMAGARIDGLSAIKGSVNWMLPVKMPGMGAWLNEAMAALVQFFLELTASPDGGKDSGSLATKAIAPDGTTVMVPSPPTLVFAPYATMKDVRRKVTPYMPDLATSLIYVDLGLGKNRLGGSALAQVYKQVGNESPDMEDSRLLIRAFNTIQSFLDQRLITSAHDRSDGGLVITLLEMAMASNCGLDVYLDPNAEVIPSLFSEEPGIVLGCKPTKVRSVLNRFNNEGIPAVQIAETRLERFRILGNSGEVLNESARDLRAIWDGTSHQLDRLQANPECVDEERRNRVFLTTNPPYQLTFVPKATKQRSIRRYKVLVVREEGSNGDREMVATLMLAGFDPWDVTMNDLHSGKIDLDEKFRGIIPVGGFAHKDVFDAAKGWAAGIRFNLKDQFERFRNRPDTFSLGVCNGAQLDLLLGWAPGLNLTPEEQPRFIQNRSGRFESRFSTVAILDSPAIMLKHMVGSKLGIWVSHGEGRLRTSNEVLSEIERLGLAPIRYVDNDGQATESYPFNPNGSPKGIAALCSADGRHLAMMPHPERTSIPWQWPWMPAEWSKLKVSPWLQMFQSARKWCDETR